MSIDSKPSCDSSVVEHPLGKREVESSILSRSTIVRFWAKVDYEDYNGCWQWNGALDRHGYGQFKTESRTSPKRSHRVAWELTHGLIPAGSSVLHDCDNPRCCNPSHLRLGTHEDNMADKRARNRAWKGGPRRKPKTA
jgi:hypothetical protein